VSVALLFSPQGSHHLGMGRELAETVPSARAVFDRADAALEWSVSDLAWHGPEDRLNDTRYTQPALLTCSTAALAALEARIDPRPVFVAGHSVGEFAALVAARVLEFEDALHLVARRGELMAAEGTTGGMAAVIGLDRGAITAVIEAVGRPTDLVVANDNAPGQVVVSGTDGALDAVEPLLRAAGAKRVIRLNVSGAFHSPAMAPVTDALADAMRASAWHEAAIPVVSNVTAEPETDARRIRHLLAEQVRSPVEWVASVRRMAEAGVDTFIECGPGSALVGMLRRIVPEARAAAVNDPASLEAVVAELERPRAAAAVASG
jgi:[acyl-carrier-protein] S-malonyltransferase